MTDEWFEHRSPPSPEGLRGRMVREIRAVSEADDLADGAPDIEGPVDQLGVAARAALGRAMSLGGTDREVAMDLLAADGLLTYACEAAVAEENPVSQIEAILSHFRDPVGP